MIENDTTPRSVSECASHFLREFQPIAQIIASHGVSWFVSTAGGSDLAAKPGGDFFATVMVGSRNAASRFGLLMGEDCLSGMRGFTYRPGDDQTTREAFIDELERRIQTHGATRYGATGVIENHKILTRGERYYEKAKVDKLARMKKQTGPWHPNAF